MTEKIELKMEPVSIKKEGVTIDEARHTLKVSFTIEARANLDLFSRVVNLQQQGARLYCIIGSEQAKMDLQIKSVTV